MAVTVRVVWPGVGAVETGQFQPWMLRLGNRVLNNSRGRVNVDTGYLRSTGTVQAAGGFDVRVAYRARYALAVHNGSRPHRITPRTRRVLAFRVGGRMVYARHVNHPGYRGNPYLAEAMREEVGRL